jgi:hypothetical protein
LKTRYLLLTGLLLAVALAACGGGSSSGGSGDEAEVTETIEKSLTEPSPTNCKERETQNFIEQTTHATGAAATKACEEEGEADSSESVDVSNVVVTGSKAKADVAFSGGSFSDQTLTLALIKDGGNWKLDEIARFAKLDKEALVNGIEEQLTELPSAVKSCIIEGLQGASNDLFESLLLKGEDQQLKELALSCQ